MRPPHRPLAVGCSSPRNSATLPYGCSFGLDLPAFGGHGWAAFPLGAGGFVKFAEAGGCRFKVFGPAPP